MKSRVFWVLWAALPILVFFWYTGPGQAVEARGIASGHLDQARQAEALGDWTMAAKEYLLAYENLPVDDREGRRGLSLRQARAAFMSGETWNGIANLEELLAEFEGTDASLAAQCRQHLGAAQYFVAWKLRLEGATSDVWKPEAEKARQHFRRLAENAQAKSDPRALAFKKNVESVIWLEQMDLSELAALPLPGGC